MSYQPDQPNLAGQDVPHTAGPTPPGYPVQPPKPVNPRLVWWTSAPGIITMLVIAGAVVALIAGISTALSGPASAGLKVDVTSCDATTTTATVGISVTNTGKQTRSATVRIEYRDGAGARLDTDTTYVRDIAPGDTVRTQESTLLDAPPNGSLTCQVTGIN